MNKMVDLLISLQAGGVMEPILNEKLSTYLNLNELGHSEEVELVKRTDLDCLTEITLDGEKTFLGEVRNFKSHPLFNKRIPKDISISWSALPAGKSLKEHYHPCASFLIITEGIGVSTGDSELEVKAGDIVYIPKWNLHGFIGKGESGFKALSIQFQETAIFESEEKPETTYFDRESIPLEERKLQIISRTSLDSIHHTIVDGERHELGTLKNFSSNPTLAREFPENFSCAWVRLENGQTLAPHTHKEDSMIIITEGEGAFSADNEFDLKSGDIVFVPAHANHGFTSNSNSGFWGLSIQFNETSLYENQFRPRVDFISPYENLIARNEKFAKDFYESNHTFQLGIQTQKDREMLLDCLQVISDHFQRLMFLRVGFCDSPRFEKVFLEHFLEELGHNKSLSKERNRPKLWDPVLESSCSWFVNKNYVLDNSGRIIMVQMVLEKCAHLFYSHFSNILQEENKSHHIESHMHADEGHDMMGVDLLKDEPAYKYKEFYRLQEESWSIMELFISRIGELIIENRREK